jgi:glycosyltransferase involved in cell wall biosynthesis
MKVAIIIPRLVQLGPVKVIQTLVNALSEFKDLYIKVYYLDKEADHNIKMLVPVEQYNSATICFDDYDIIHTNGIRPDLIAFLNRRKIRYHISTIHNLVFDDLEFTYNRIISLIFGNVWLFLWKRADKLVCISETMKNYYSGWFSDSKLKVIYNGIAVTDNSIIPDNDLIQKIVVLKSKGLKVIGCTGILTKRKGIDQLLYLISEKSELALVIIGYGKELHTLLRLSKRLGIADKCIFGGFRSNAVNYLKYFDLFVLPSRSEGFGLALIEAVQKKIPVICSDIGVFRELMSSDEVTFYRLEDQKSLTEAVEVATETRSFKPGLAYTRYEKNYTDSLMAKNYFDLYRSF